MYWLPFYLCSANHCVKSFQLFLILLLLVNDESYDLYIVWMCLDFMYPILQEYQFMCICFFLNGVYMK
jgi:hypothetical protein